MVVKLGNVSVYVDDSDAEVFEEPKTWHLEKAGNGYAYIRQYSCARKMYSAYAQREIAIRMGLDVDKKKIRLADGDPCNLTRENILCL